MGFATSNQGRPIQGVSQQPTKSRRVGQCTSSDNFTPDVVKGLSTRTGTTLSAEDIAGSKSKLDKWHYYDRGTEETYFIRIENTTGELSVWDKDGVEQVVNVEDDAEALYLAAADPSDTLKMLTIGDYTFIANTNIVVEDSAGVTPVGDPIGMVYVQFMDYSQTITVSIDDVVEASYTSPDGSIEAHKALISVDYVTEQLYDDLVVSLPGVQWTITLHNNTIDVINDTVDFTLTVSDDANGANAIALKDSISSTTLLPKTAQDGFTIEIDPPGSSVSGNNNYWLKAVNVTGTFDVLKWVETTAPGISTGIDPLTMPHVLVREDIILGIATFTLRKGEWEERRVGDLDTNPSPSFVGSEIQSIGLFQNRLFFTALEAVIMSRSAYFFDFYRETAQLSSDTDPVDVYADATDVNYLSDSVAFDGDLTFFSTRGQFLLSGKESVTPSTATLRQTTTFDTKLSASPVASGDSIFFAFNYGIYTGIREFFTDSVTDTKRARPVTDHVKEYILGDPEIMVTSTSLNLLVIKAEADNILYVYDWLWQGSDKVQSAWGKFILGENDVILFMTFQEDILFLVMDREDIGLTFEKYEVNAADDTGLEESVRADVKRDITLIKDTDGIYKVDNPFPSIDVEDIVVIRSTGAYESEKGTEIAVYVEGTELWSGEDLGDDAVLSIAGLKYKCEYTPSNPVALDESGQALNLDRLQVGTYYMNYVKSGDVTATVTDRYGNERKLELTNRTLGGPENIIGHALLVEGQHKVPIRKKSDSYILSYMTDSHEPLIVRDFEYNGNLSRRGKRI